MYPLPYIEYLIYFHCFRDYFECHEVLEEYWKDRDKKEIVWVGFIQLAVGLYHYRRNNTNGAIRQLSRAKLIFTRDDINVDNYGINKERLYQVLSLLLKDIEDGVPYSPIDLPIENNELKKQCEQLSLQKGVKWNEEIPCNDPFIIHKHKLRDRSAVINQRLQELEKRKK